MVAAGTAVSPPAAEKPRAKAGGEGEKQDHGRGQDQDPNEDPRWRSVLALPCLVTVDLPLAKFTVADFVKLRTGSVVATAWRVSHDVPLRANGTLIAWAEFEGAGNRLAVRLTELA
jgi:flagellar motor switch/type III secretory pathway protein FliN